MKSDLFNQGAVSTFGADVDQLFYTMVGVCTITAIAVICLIIVFSLRYRRGRKANRHISNPNARWPEYLWIGIPLIIFMVFFFWGAHLYLRYQQVPENPLVIRGVAKQWMWKFYHPGGQREINELHIPVDRPVLLRLVSEDVIHSFFVPSFRIKQDVVPGRYNHAAFTVDKEGVYRLFCAEFCGTDHSQMRGMVAVLGETDYAHWLQQQQTPPLAEAGENLFRAQGCGGCHRQGSTVYAPDLTGIAGRVVNLQNGGTVVADSVYLRDAMLLPEKHIVAGYKPIMPSYANQMSEEELFKLVTYLQSLAFTANTPSDNSKIIDATETGKTNKTRELLP